jgi:hypothetical protein
VEHRHSDATQPKPDVTSGLIAIAARMAKPVDFIFVELWP